MAAAGAGVGRAAGTTGDTAALRVGVGAAAHVTHGALRSAWIGYWVTKQSNGGGVATAALALGLDHAFGPVMLHRVEATVRPENLASRAVLAKAGFREEGLLKRYLDVDGAWRDHLLVAITVEEVDGSVAAGLVRSGRARWT